MLQALLQASDRMLHLGSDLCHQRLDGVLDLGLGHEVVSGRFPLVRSITLGEKLPASSLP